MRFIVLSCFLLAPVLFFGQPCMNPAGDQTTYGTNNQWIGYVYDSLNFTNYHGFIKEGTAADPSFDEYFGGDYDSIRPVGGCPVYTETFSVRFKLQQSFADGNYEILVGADDGFRLSVDGGATWIINEWSDHGFINRTATVHLSGITNLVLEYYENAVINHIKFEMHQVCTATGPENVYGTNDQWIGYVYNDSNFTHYRGTITEGLPSNPSFYEDFGTTEGFAKTSQCYFIAETFSVRFRLRKPFPTGSYTFKVGGDDGYRLSLDGGATWTIENYVMHSYTTTSKTIVLNGTYDMVLEYFDFDGDNIVSFELQQATLPIHLLSFTATKKSASQNLLKWTASKIEAGNSFVIERSADGIRFAPLDIIPAGTASAQQSFTYIDEHPLSGNNFYRVQMKISNAVLYSTIRMVGNSLDQKLVLFPNPVTDHAIHFNAPSENFQVNILEYSGKLLLQKIFTQVSEGQLLQIQLPATFAKGTYLFSYTDKQGNKFDQKFIAN